MFSRLFFALQALISQNANFDDARFFGGDTALIKSVSWNRAGVAEVLIWAGERRTFSSILMAVGKYSASNHVQWAAECMGVMQSIKIE